MTRFKRMALFLGATLGWAFVSSVPTRAWSAQADALTVAMTPYDIYPPSAITDLSALPGGVGQMLLQWTAPDGNNYVFTNRSPADSYTIRIATFSIDSVGGSTTTWWNAAQDVAGEPAPSIPGVTDSILLNGLTTDLTYYAAIKSADANGNVSPIDVNASTPGQQASAFLPGSLSPPTPNNFAGVALTTVSVQWSWDLVGSATFYNLYEFPSDILVLQSTASPTSETGFTPNMAVRRILRSGNSNGLSAPTADVTVYTLANVPTGLSISSVTYNQISLSWNANANPIGTNYRLERSGDGSSYGPVVVSTNLNHIDSGLAELTSYYYRVVALNGDDVASAPSVAVSTFTPQRPDIISPSIPMGLKGSLDPTGQAFTLIWEAVTQNDDGTPCTDLRGYNIYRRDSLTGIPTKITPVPIVITAFADVVGSQTRYYTVRAVDTIGNESAESLLADSSLDVNIIFLGPDGQSSVFMPEAVNDLLRSAYNPYGVPLTVRLTEEPLPNNNEIVRHIKLSLVRTDTNEALDNIAFAKPQSVVGVGYSSVAGQVVPGEPVPGQQPDISAAVTTPDKLSLFWFNGVTWVKVGGVLDLFTQSLRTKSSFLGHFQLRISAAATSLTLDQGNVYPRVFSPNSDGFNDRVYFILENPKNSSVRGEILDLKGRHVASLTPANNTGIGTTLTWDGKDDTGSTVPSGAYMYKIEGEGKTFTGTVAVAR